MRILLVSPYRPDDMSFGAGQRTVLMYRGLQAAGEVTTLILREGELPSRTLAPAAGVVAEIGYSEPSLLNKYRQTAALGPLIRDVVNLDSFDIIVGKTLGPLLALPRFRGLSIVDADDSYYRFSVSDRPGSRMAAACKTHAKVIVRQRALRRFDHVWFCCERDQRHFSLRSSSILPNVVATTDATVESVREAEPIVLMVGALWYQPNRDAIESFLRDCWADIRRQVPGARFRAVGAAPADLRKQWSSLPGVECPGFVDDLSPEYRRARVTVVTVRSGGGTQIKTLESLAHGRVPVVSSFVASGFAGHLAHGETMYVADDNRSVVKRIVTMLKDPSASEPVARRGQQVVRDVFSREKFHAALSSSLASLTNDRWR